MSGFDDACARIKVAKSDLTSVRLLYEDAVSRREITEELRVRVGQVIEGLRSALDYCGQELYDRCCPPGNAKVYFPIASPTERNWPSYAERMIPGLPAARPDLVHLMAEWQATQGARNQWLADLATLANKSKHRHLIPQTRRERQGLRMGTNVSVVGGFIRIEDGAAFNVQGRQIEGPRCLDPNDPPEELRGLVDADVWVDLVWDVDGCPIEVMRFLEHAVEKVAEMVCALKQSV